MVIYVLTTFATSYTTTYLINERHANLGADTSTEALIFANVVGIFFFNPKLEGKTPRRGWPTVCTWNNCWRIQYIQTKKVGVFIEEELRTAKINPL